MGESVKTNVKGMSRIAFKVFCMGMICAAIILIFGILGGNGLEEIKYELNFVTGYVNMFIILVFGVTLSTYYIKVVLSFGSTRKGYFIGKNICNIILIAVAIILDILAYAVSDSLKMKTIVLLFAMMFFLTGAGNLIGIVITKYGMKGYIAFVIICGVIGGAVGGSYSSGWLKKVLNVSYIDLIALAGGIAVYIVMGIVEYKMIDKYEIK